MANDRGPGEGMTPTAEHMYGETRLPHKFCPYCGARNEGRAERCERCGKDISWMRVPQPTTTVELPPVKPRSLPEQQKVFSRRAIAIIIALLALLIAGVVLLVIFKGKPGGESAVFIAASLTGLALSRPLTLLFPPPGGGVRWEVVCLGSWVVKSGSAASKARRSQGLCALSRNASRFGRCSRATSRRPRA